MALIIPGAGIFTSSSTALLTSIAILITNEYIYQKLKIRHTKLRDWINVITMLHEKTLKISMIEEEVNLKETEQLKQISNHYIDKKTEIMKNTQFKVEDVFTDGISKDTISTEQIPKLKNFFEMM